MILGSTKSSHNPTVLRCIPCVRRNEHVWLVCDFLLFLFSEFPFFFLFFVSFISVFNLLYVFTLDRSYHTKSYQKYRKYQLYHQASARSKRQLGHVVFTLSHILMHISWKTCLSEHGKTTTSLSVLKSVIQIEQIPPQLSICSCVGCIVWGSLTSLRCSYLLSITQTTIIPMRVNRGHNASSISNTTVFEFCRNQ